MPAMIELPKPRQEKDEVESWKHNSRAYAEAVAAHVEQKNQYSALPYENFRWFALFLQGYQRPPEYPPIAFLEKDKYSFATIHDLSGDETTDDITEICGPQQLQQLAYHRSPQASCGQALFLRGFPSCEWLNLVGSKYGVDPEFFRRHLEFRIPTERFFELPGLSSSNHNILKLYVTSIGRHNGTTATRDAGPEGLAKHWETLKSNEIVGDSIVRRFNWHTDEYFSIEQHISVCVIRSRVLGSVRYPLHISWSLC
jgi:hypothetical protein